ncbi:MAG: hypothetical protein ACTSQU_07515 [Promethearchaeota archaeon]
MQQKNENSIIIRWLAHHNQERADFNSHILYLFNHAVCLGCFSFLLGAIVGLITGNLFYSYIASFLSFPIAFSIFLICWLPSIFQYSIQILAKKPINNRAVKFLTRFLYPIGSIVFIFTSPIWGFLLAVPAGYGIVLIRKVKIKSLSKNE